MCVTTNRSVRPVSGMRARAFPFIAAGLAYLLLACLAFWQIAANFSTAIPGFEGRHTDFALFYWDVWWFQHAVLHLGQDPYFTNYILFPHTLNLAYHTFVPFLDVIAFPIYMIFGLVVAINSLIIGSLVFSGLAMFAFLRHNAIPAGLAFIGGALFAFTSFSTARVSYVHLSMLPIGWLPVGLLIWDRLVEHRTLGSAVMLCGTLYAALMTDLQFGMWLALLLVPYTLFRLLQVDARVRGRIVVLGALAGAMLVALALIAPLPQLQAGRDTAYPRTPLRSVQVRSTQLSDLVAIPPRYFDSERDTLGVLLPLCVVVGFVRGRRAPGRVLWLMVAAACLVLALGPTFEPLRIPLPYRLIHIVAGGMYRVPARFILPAVVALIVFACLSLQADYQRLTRAGRIVGILGALVFLALENRWHEPFPIFSLPDYRIYHEIGADPDEYLILEVPVGSDLGVADRFGDGSELQYYAPIHHKRLINGSISRAASGITGSYRQWLLITALAEEGPVPDLEGARSEFQRLSAEWDILYVVIHREMLPPLLAHWAVVFFNTQPGWCLADEEASLIAFRRIDDGVCRSVDLLQLPWDGTIHFGDGSDERYLGLGWYPAENIGGPQARWIGDGLTAALRVRLARQDYRVTLHATSFPRDQVVSVYANERQVASLSIGEGWSEYVFDLAAAVIPPDGVVTFAFVPARFESAFARAEGQSDDRRLLAVACDFITFTPNGAWP